MRLQQAGPVPLDVGFECAEGELLALVGPSGSGKTSVLRAIAGLMPVADGEVLFDGRPWLRSRPRVHVPPEQRPVGMVFQNYALFPHLSAHDNVALALPPGSDPAQAGALLADMQLDALAARRPAQWMQKCPSQTMKTLFSTQPHVNAKDPIKYWQTVHKEQEKSAGC